MPQFASITIDLQEAFDGLGLIEQEAFIEHNIGRASTDGLAEELISRGYNVFRGDEIL